MLTQKLLDTSKLLYIKTRYLHFVALAETLFLLLGIIVIKTMQATDYKQFYILLNSYIFRPVCNMCRK